MKVHYPNHRVAGQNWSVELEGGDTVSAEEAQLLVLMDIRGELKKLNKMLACPNFIGIPRTLKSILRKLPTPKKQPRKK